MTVRSAMTLDTMKFPIAALGDDELPRGSNTDRPVLYLHIHEKLLQTGAKTTMPQARTRRHCLTTRANPSVERKFSPKEFTMSNVIVWNPLI